MVTGASTGIGRAIAGELIGLGALVGIAARSRKRLDESAAALGAGCTAAVADVTRGENVRRLVDGTIECTGASTSLSRMRACTSAGTCGRATPRRSTA